MADKHYHNIIYVKFIQSFCYSLLKLTGILEDPHENRTVEQLTLNLRTSEIVFLTKRGSPGKIP